MHAQPQHSHRKEDADNVGQAHSKLLNSILKSRFLDVSLCDEREGRGRGWSLEQKQTSGYTVPSSFGVFVCLSSGLAMTSFKLVIFLYVLLHNVYSHYDNQVCKH